MKFRPCIDLHDGQVKQIVGSTLIDNEKSDDDNTTTTTNATSSNSTAVVNFVSNKPASEYALLYQNDALVGGHVIMLGPGNTKAAMDALQAAPNTLQVGGGITLDNAQQWLDAGATHVIITSYVFTDGNIRLDRLEQLKSKLGKHRIVLDLSCRKKPKNSKSYENEQDDNDDTNYYVVTDRWQKFTNFPVTETTLQQLSTYCDEFLIHAVDVEGKQGGILNDIVLLLGKYSPIPCTYAGGIRSLDDLNLIEQLGNGKVDCTIGSALDIFGGKLKYTDVIQWHQQRNPQ